MKKGLGKNCSRERSINQDLEESLPSYRRRVECAGGLDDGGSKGNKKVDFHLESTPELQQSSEVMNGAAVGCGGGVVQDFINPYTDNLYININVNNNGEAMKDIH